MRTAQAFGKKAQLLDDVPVVEPGQSRRGQRFVTRRLEAVAGRAGGKLPLPGLRVARDRR